jgi:peptide/nickel transport system substrate-binding protein
MVRSFVIALVLITVVAGCTAPGPTGRGTESRRGGAADAPQQRAVKRVTAAIKSDPGSLVMRVNPSSAGLPGLNILQMLVGTGLAERDQTGMPRPHLAVDVPTLENGLWKVFPEGRMETTWKIRPNATWHDGTPVTSADVLFTAEIDQDKELDVIPNAGYVAVDRIEAPDPHTVVVHWKQPYIQPDQLFSVPLLPKHVLEQTYTEAKPTFGLQSYWTRDYVGAGPFRVRDFEGANHVVLDAFDRYVLGRPKIDELEVKFIPDSNALTANIVAGAVELTLGSGLSLEEAISVQEQWREGKAQAGLNSWVIIWPQFLNPTPDVVRDVRFRRAMLQAIDRQQLIDGLVAGRVPVADAFISPGHPLHSAVESRIRRYPYDARQAAEAIQQLGYAKGGDGMFRDAAGQPLGVEIRASGGRALTEKTVIATADFWRAAGVEAQSNIIPQQRLRDREFVQTFPAFWSANQPKDLSSLNRFVSSQAPLAENNFVGNNNPRYMSPEYDALVGRVFSTIPTNERTAIIADVVQHMTENLVVMPLFYNSEPAMVANRIQGVTVGEGEGWSQTWNAHEWDVR